MTFFLGLDLGQAQDPTAVAILEWRALPGTEKIETWGILRAGATRDTPRREVRVTVTDPGAAAFACGYLKRLRLGTPYPAVADHVIALLETAPLKGQTQLVVDATGVGRPVVDMLRQRGLTPVAITITGGDSVTYDRGYRVPARDLIGSVQVLLQTDRLKFAAGIPAVPQLVQELLAFRVKINPLTAHDSYGNREGQHDDMVFAVAVAAWWGQRWQPPAPKRDIGSRSY